MNQSISHYDLAPPAACYELARRSSGGTSVCLVWRPLDDDVAVYVSDEASGDAFVLEPPKSSALDAFYHPYAFRQPHGPLSAGRSLP